MRKTLTTGFALLLALAAAPRACADFWREVGIAGELPSTAQVTAGGGSLDQIIGELHSTTHADMYQIFITGGGTFSATTVGTPGTLNDTQLFLFDATGHGVYANDDANSSTRRSTLPAGNPLTPLTPGLYYLAISAFDRDPVGGPTNDLIFPSFGPGFTGVVGPTGPGGAFPVSDWRGTGVETGTYVINLTGAGFAVPEPGSLTLLSSGVAVFLAYAWRRHKKAA
jgi:hypothetical protein